VTGKIYVDGRLDEYGRWVRSEGGARASLAYDAALKSYYKGSIDEVAVYNHPLTAAQVLAHYVASGHVPRPVYPPGTLRARILGSTAASLPFSLTRPPDRYVLPFGGGGGRK
jgi:hypothetical protein